jgi:DNA-binding PadR family transcriptional regulator
MKSHVFSKNFAIPDLKRWILLHSLSISPKSGMELLGYFRQASLWGRDAGSTFRRLEELLDEGWVEYSSSGVRKAYRITDVGRKAFETDPKGPQCDKIYQTLVNGLDSLEELDDAHLRLRMALENVAEHANDDQRRVATKIALRASRELYDLLTM